MGTGLVSAGEKGLGLSQTQAYTTAVKRAAPHLPFACRWAEADTQQNSDPTSLSLVRLEHLLNDACE